MHSSEAAQDLVTRRRELDDALASPNQLPFVSDWTCEHPFVDDFLGPGPRSPNAGSYIYLDHDTGLKHRIRDFHRSVENSEYSLEEIVPGAGSSTFITAFCLWLRSRGVKEVYYFPPIYVTFHHVLENCGIRMIPLTAQPLSLSPSLNLPPGKVVCILSDPIWVMGRRVPRATIETIAEWQRATGSFVFVDGSFQYLQWSEDRLEWSSVLPRESTFRLVCPTKALALHGVRFSYLLVPEPVYREFGFQYSISTGSASFADQELAHRLMVSMNSPSANLGLTRLIAALFRRFRSRVLDVVEPECGYFLFARPFRSSRWRAMTPDFFELSGFDGYVRVNLLSPAVASLLSDESLTSSA